MSTSRAPVRKQPKAVQLPVARRQTTKARAAPEPATPNPGRLADLNLGSFKEVFLADPLTRVQIIKRGVAANTVEALARSMGRPKDRLMGQLGLAVATVNRRVRDGKALSTEDSERVVGMARLIGQVQAMVEASGNARGFSAAQWVGQWIDEPLPALGGRRPSELMDTAEGQGIVADLLGRMQSGAYA